jgi:hypothetical protein
MVDFRIGQKVQCVDGSKPDGRGHCRGETFPTEGSIYTVRGFVNELPEETLLEEIINPPRQYKDGFAEVSFRTERFRCALGTFG